MKDYQTIEAAEDNLVAVLKLYDNIDMSVDMLQVYYCNILRTLQPMDKKDLVDEDNRLAGGLLAQLVTKFPKGADRGSFVAWMRKYTPIRYRFNDGNGHFEGLGFAKKPRWNLDGAHKEAWFDVDPERLRKVTKPDLDKMVELLAISVAKLAAVTDTSEEQLTERLAKKFDAEFCQKSKDLRVSPKVQGFKSDWIDQVSASNTH